jgi:hypothetical protein
MRRSIACMCSVLFLALLLPTGAAAQAASQDKLADLLVDFYTDNAIANYQIFLELKKTYPALVVSQTDVINSITPAYLFNRQLGSQLSSFPLGSSAGGFTWTFSPDMGAFRRSSESFGPIFAERALTVGKKKLNLGFNYQHASFNNIEGKSLSDKSIKVYSTASLYGTTIFIEDALNLKVSSDTFDIYGTLGVTDRFDLGFAIPVVSVDMDASLSSRVGQSPGTIGNELDTFSRSGSASGIGDVVLRAKYTALKTTSGGIAAAADVRLGTGDEMDFLGLPGSQVKIYAIGSAAYGKFSPHFNVGYTASSGSDVAEDETSPLLEPPDEVNYVGGVDWAATPRVTVAVDFLGRTLLDAGRLVDSPTSFSSAYTQFTLEDGNLNQALLAIGGKVNPFSNVLVTVNVLVPLARTGLTGTTWVLGFDYSF